MSHSTFSQLLDGVIRAGLESGLSPAEVHEALAVAGMALDDQRVDEAVNRPWSIAGDEPPPY